MFGFRWVKVLSKIVYFFKLGSVNLSNLHCRSVDICSSTSKEEALWARRSRGRDGGCRAGPSVTMSRSGLLHILPLPHKVTNNKIMWFTSQLTTVSPSIANNVRKKGRRLVVELAPNHPRNSPYMLEWWPWSGFTSTDTFQPKETQQISVFN